MTSTKAAPPAAPAIETTTIDVGDALKAYKADLSDAWHQAFQEIVFRAHGFGGKRQIDGSETFIGGVKIDDDLVDKAKAKLIPDELAKPWDQAVSRLRRILERYCRRADDESHWFVSTTRNSEFVPLFEEQLAAAEAAADAIAAAYPEIVAKCRDRWLQHFKGNEDVYQGKIGRHLPSSAAALRAYYRIDYFPVVRDANTKKFAVGPIASFFQRAYGNYAKAAEDARRSRYSGVVADIRESVAALATKMQAAKVPPASISAILSQLESFSIVADVLDRDLYEQVEKLRDALTKSHEAGKFAVDAGGRYWQTVKKDREALASMAKRLLQDCEAATARLDDGQVPVAGLSVDDDEYDDE